MPSSTSTLPGSLPCLAFHHSDQSTVLFSVSEKKPIGSDVDELKGKTICPTAQGFLLARDPTSLATFLWSPQTNGKVQLPPLQASEDLLIYCNCLLSDKPTAPGCVVLLVEPDETFIWYCYIGDGQWVRLEYDIGTLPQHPLVPPDEKVVITPIAACRGKFYFNTEPTSMGVIEFCPTPVFKSIDIDETVDAGYGCDDDVPAEIFSVESNQELYMVRLLFLEDSMTIHTASIHRMDFSVQRWRKVDDLGDRTFLLSPFNFGASIAGGMCGFVQNCVYSVSPRKKSLMIFNIKDGTTELQKLDEAPASATAFWMLPTNPL